MALDLTFDLTFSWLYQQREDRGGGPQEEEAEVTTVEAAMEVAAAEYTLTPPLAPFYLSP